MHAYGFPFFHYKIFSQKSFTVSALFPQKTLFVFIFTIDYLPRISLFNILA